MGLGINIIGGPGSGKHDIARLLAAYLKWPLLFISDYDLKSDNNIPYDPNYVKGYKIGKLAKDINQNENFILVGSVADLDHAFDTSFKMVVMIKASLEERTRRFNERAYEVYGKKILKKGVMNKKHVASLWEMSKYDKDGEVFPNYFSDKKWAMSACPAFYREIDGDQDISKIVEDILVEYSSLVWPK